MLKLTETDQYVVYDDVLDEQQFSNLQSYIKNEKYTIPHVAGWEKVWKLTDSFPMGGPPYYKTKMPFNNSLDVISHYILEISKTHKNLIDNFEEVTFRSYLYPPGTKLSWHNDHGYRGAAIFYAHKEWKSSWGGELMIAHVPSDLSGFDEENTVSHFGIGHYISCKPNRLVLTKAGVWHSINRVDANAGENVRSTIIGFFS